MLKKLMLMVSCVSLFALVACGDENEIEPVETEESDIRTSVEETVNENGFDFGFFIEILSDEDFAELETCIEVDYAEARGGFINAGLNLIFHFNQPVTDFSFIEIEFREDGSVIQNGVLYEVGDINPDLTLVLTHYHTQGAVPASGFHFTDLDGVPRWFVLDQSQIDASIIWTPFSLNPTYEYYDEDRDVIEEVEIEVNSNRSEELEFTFFLERLSDEELELLDHYTPYDYSWDVDDLDFGMNIAFNFNQVVTDFAIIGVGFDDSEDALTFVKTAVLQDIGDITVGSPIVLTRYRTAGTLPISGFTFTDPDGIDRWFVFQESQMDGSITWRPFHWDRSYGLAIWTHNYHEVVAGETLFSISQEYDIAVDWLQQLNDLGDGTDINVGQRLRLPTGYWVTD